MIIPLGCCSVIPGRDVHSIQNAFLWSTDSPCSNFQIFISPVQSSGLQPSAYLNHFKWSFCLGENSLVIVTLSIFDQWADSLPLACLVNSESFLWFGLSKPCRTCISCWFKYFSYDGTKEYRLGMNWADETKYHHEKKKNKKNKITQGLIHTIWPYIKGPSTHFASIKLATRKLCNITLYLKYKMKMIN